jgi:hypothetical protein
MFLTDPELCDYTGLRQAAAQSRFLRRSGIRHIVNAANKVRLTWDAVNGGAGKVPKGKARIDQSVFDQAS